MISSYLGSAVSRRRIPTAKSPPTALLRLSDNMNQEEIQLRAAPAVQRATSAQKYHWRVPALAFVGLSLSRDSAFPSEPTPSTLLRAARWPEASSILDAVLHMESETRARVASQKQQPFPAQSPRTSSSDSEPTSNQAGNKSPATNPTTPRYSSEDEHLKAKEAMRKLEGKVGQRMRERDRVTRYVENLEDQRDELFDELNATKVQLQTAGKQVTAQKARKRQVQKAMWEKESQLLDKNAEIQRLSKDTKQKQMTIAEKDRVIEMQKSETQKLLKDVEDMVGLIGKQKKLVENKDAALQELSCRIEAKDKELAAKDAEISDLKLRLRKTTSERTVFKMQVDQAEAANKALSAEKQVIADEKQVLINEKRKLLTEGFPRLEKTIAERDEKILYLQTEMQDNYQRNVQTINNLRLEKIGLQEQIKHLNNWIAQRDDSQVIIPYVRRIDEVLQEVERMKKENVRFKHDQQNMIIVIQQTQNLFANSENQAMKARQEATEECHKRLRAESELESVKLRLDDLRAALMVDSESESAESNPDNELAAIRLDMSEHNVPSEVISRVTRLILSKDIHAEELLEKIQKVKSKKQDYRVKFEKAESELDRYIFNEVDRRSEVETLHEKLANQEVIQTLLRNERDRYIAYIQQASASARQPWELYTELETKLRSQEEELIQLKNEVVPLKEHHKQIVSYYEAVEKKLKRKAKDTHEYAVTMTDCYYYEAIHKNRRLHKELAKYKKLAGETHTIPKVVPLNKFVHERRMVTFALKAGASEQTMENLPEEFRDPDFIKGWHPATRLAMRRLMPKIFELQAQTFKTTWYQPTVPILTEYGNLDQEGDPAATGARMRAMVHELNEINDRDPHYEDSEIGADDEPLSATYWEPVEECDDHSDADSSAGDGTESTPADGQPSTSGCPEGPECNNEDADGRPAWFQKRKAEVDAKEKELKEKLRKLGPNV